jgi:hypothetical protein
VLHGYLYLSGCHQPVSGALAEPDRVTSRLDVADDGIPHRNYSVVYPSPGDIHHHVLE